MMITNCIRVIKRNIHDVDTFEYIRKSLLENASKTVTSTQPSVTPPSLEQLQAALVQAMEAQLPPPSGPDVPSVTTPSQRFYRENKQLLLKRVSEIYSQDNDTWKKFPVMRPPPGHLWTFGEDPAEYMQPEFEVGKFPSVENILLLLTNEQVAALRVVDLGAVGRRDLGERCVIGTVQTAKHGNRVAEILVNTINNLHIPHIRASCPISDRNKHHDWVVVNFGGVVVHLMTADIRARLNVEAVLLEPDIWLNATAVHDFPHYPNT